MCSATVRQHRLPAQHAHEMVDSAAVGSKGPIAGCPRVLAALRGRLLVEGGVSGRCDGPRGGSRKVGVRRIVVSGHSGGGPQTVSAARAREPATATQDQWLRSTYSNSNLYTATNIGGD
jgi:hypothetical protein